MDRLTGENPHWAKHFGLKLMRAEICRHIVELYASLSPELYIVNCT